MKGAIFRLLMCQRISVFVIIGLATTLTAAPAWTDITAALLKRLASNGAEPGWPGGCAGLVVDRLTGDLTVKVIGQGLWRSSDRGDTWQRLDENVISGRDETGWATSVDQNLPTRIASFSLDGTAGWASDGRQWKKFADLGRNWDYGSVDWSAPTPTTIIAAKHETTPPGEVYATSDGGRTWRKLSVHLQEARGQVSMIGALGASTFIFSKGEGILRSTDAGATWSKVSTFNPQTRIPVFFRDAHYLGTAAGLLVSRDKGATWKVLGTAVDIWLGPYFGSNEQEMLVVGKKGIFQTADAGETWERVSDLKPKADGFLFDPNWFGCYAWDPVNHFVYASSMGNPVFRKSLGK